MNSTLGSVVPLAMFYICPTLQPLDVVGDRLDVLLAAVHPLVEGVVGRAPRHRDVLVHVQLQQQLLLGFGAGPEKKKHKL